MPTLKKPNRYNRISQSIKRDERIAIYSSTKWQKLRLAKLQDQPLCEMCLKNDIITPATQVHHIKSFMDYNGTERLKYAYKLDNLMSICAVCHQKIHNGKSNK